MLSYLSSLFYPASQPASNPASNPTSNRRCLDISYTGKMELDIALAREQNIMKKEAGLKILRFMQKNHSIICLHIQFATLLISIDGFVSKLLKCLKKKWYKLEEGTDIPDILAKHQKIYCLVNFYESVINHKMSSYSSKREFDRETYESLRIIWCTFYDCKQLLDIIRERIRWVINTKNIVPPHGITMSRFFGPANGRLSPGMYRMSLVKYY